MEEVAAHRDVSSLGAISLTARAADMPSRRPLSILHVHSGNLFGGIERAILTCVENLNRAPSIAFEFALCFDGQLRDQLAAAGQTIHRLPEVRTRNPLTILAARQHLTRLLRQKHYDVALCHSPWTHSLFAPVIRRAGVPELFWAHDHFSGKHWLERWARRSKPDFVISNSHYSEESISQIFPGIAHETLRCPVSTSRVRLTPEHRSRLRSELKTPDDAVVILQVSRMEPGKGHPLLLDVAANLSNTEGWFMWFVGGAQRAEEQVYLQELKATAARLGISTRIRFAGERNDVPKLMVAADLLCQPNTRPDSFGLVFVEAIANALPVLTFAMGGAIEIIDETCGILVPAANHESFMAELERLIRDKDLRRQLGEAGPARAKALCDPDVILPQLEKLVSRLSRAK